MISTPVPNYEPATINKRIVAKGIDVAVLFILIMVVGLIIDLIAAGLSSILKDSVIAGNIAGIAAIITFLLVLIGYEVIPIQRWGQTLGKKAMKLHVLDKEGKGLSFWRSLLRCISFYIIAIVSFFLIFATLTVLGWVILGALRKYQRLPHEWLSGSYTLQEFKGQPSLSQPEAGVVQPMAGTLQRPVIAATPFADLERLRAEGMISEEQYQAKRQELHIK
jgi:uncharacterized RDD family membrane protein YckC